MAYIGNKPTVGNFQICDAISVVNGQAAYTMQVGSVNVIPQSANHMIVSLNGTIQKPNSSFTVSGSTITFASNLATGDVIDFIQILGDVLDLGVPSDATVTTAKLADSSVTTAKLNDASVSLAKLTASGTKDATTFLRGDNTFAEAGGGKINQVLQTDASYDTTSSSAVELFSLAITPSASNSKISIIYSASAQLQNNEYCSFDLYRGSLSSGTKIQDGEGSFFVAGSSANIRMYYSSSDLDSPNTTSATTYTVVGVPTNSSTIQFGAGGRGSITLMEVLA